MARLIASGSFLLAVGVAPTASAQSDSEAAQGPTPQDRALAEALFREGKKLGEEGKIAEACGKFKESQRLDPTLGTLLHLAACYEEEGKTASAWAAFNAAAELAARVNQNEREELARERAAALETELARITISVAEPPEGLVLFLDGRALGEGSLGTPLPVDPGVHMLEATAPGKQAWKQQIEIAKGPSEQTLEVPALEAAPAEPRAAAAPPPVDPGPRAQGRERGNGQFVAGLVVGGVGLAGVGVGSFFGLRAASQADDADAHCRGSVCTQQGLDGHEDAQSSAMIANIAFGVGLAGLAVGTYLVVTSSSGAKPAQAALWVGAGAGQVSAGGSF